MFMYIRAGGHCSQSSVVKVKDVNRHSEAFSSMEPIWLNLAMLSEICKMSNSTPKSEAIRNFEAVRKTREKIADLALMSIHQGCLHHVAFSGSVSTSPIVTLGEVRIIGNGPSSGEGL